MGAQRKSSQKLMCENSLFRIFFEKVKSDDGTIVPNYLVVSPKNKSKNLVTGVAILPVVAGKFALLNIYRPALKGESWEVPRGFVEEGEENLTSVVRELKEETGLICNNAHVRSLGYITPEAGILEARIHLFVALDCKREKKFSANELGHKEMRLLSFSKMKKMIAKSTIQDPSTIVSFYRYQDFIKSK